jgi:phage anti-repressor protein
MNTHTSLIPIYAGEISGAPTQVVNARELHKFLEVETRFNGWISARINEYDFIENQDFISFTENSAKPQGGRPVKEYHLSLDMAKELSMVDVRCHRRQATCRYVLVTRPNHRKTRANDGRFMESRS